MSSPFGRMHIIVNPSAGRGAVQRGWPAVKAVLDDAGASYDLTVTERPGHGTEAARVAIEAGCRFVVAVGGDGTIHEVVNGMMGSDGPLVPDAVLGVVAAGSGSDFIKTFGLPRDPASAAGHLLGEDLWGALDVGRVRFRLRDGSEATRWFANIAESGLGADVVAAAAGLPKWLGQQIYRAATLKEVFKHHPVEATVKLRGRSAYGVASGSPLEEIEHRGLLSILVVANCQFFGGGMRVAPRAVPGDGLLDVQISSGKKIDAIKALAKISKGTHVPSSTILEFLATSVTLETVRPIQIEADGDVLGLTPATFDVVPGALRLKV